MAKEELIKQILQAGDDLKLSAHIKHLTEKNMKYAKLLKLGGELIEASEADYTDYKGFLRCPECGEVVFLRKQHRRGDIVIADAFVHHRAVPEVSACELRVGAYSPEIITASASQARGQRLRKLSLSLWKYLKSNLACDLKNWVRYVKEAKDYPMLKEVAKYGEDMLVSNQQYFLQTGFPRIAEYLRTKDVMLQISPDVKKVFDDFLNSTAKDWKLHCKISAEALELLITSPSMAEIRHRLCCYLTNPETLEHYPKLLDLDMETEEWKENFGHYYTIQVALIFLSVNWVAIWD